jgi:hypothetical protein
MSTAVQQQKKNRQIDISQNAINKRKQSCEYAKVSSPGSLKLTGAKQKWKSDPDFIYEQQHMIAGNEEDVRKFFENAEYEEDWIEYYVSWAFSQENTAEGEFNEAAFNEAVQECKKVRTQYSEEDIETEYALGAVSEENRLRFFRALLLTYKKAVQGGGSASKSGSPKKSGSPRKSEAKSEEEKYNELEEGQFRKGLTDARGRFTVKTGPLSQGYHHVTGTRLAAKNVNDYKKLLERYDEEFLQEETGKSKEELVENFKSALKSGVQSTGRKVSTTRSQKPTSSSTSRQASSTRRRANVPGPARPQRRQQQQQEEEEAPDIASPE